MLQILSNKGTVEIAARRSQVYEGSSLLQGLGGPPALQREVGTAACLKETLPDKGSIALRIELLALPLHTPRAQLSFKFHFLHIAAA